MKQQKSMDLVRKHFCAFPLGLSLRDLEIKSKALAEIVIMSSFKIRAKQTSQVCDMTSLWCYWYKIYIYFVIF